MGQDIWREILEQGDIEKGLCFNQDAIYEMCKALSCQIKELEDYEKIDLIVGPVVGNVNPAHIVATLLGKKSQKLSKDLDETLCFKDPNSLAGKRVLIVEEFATKESENIKEIISAVNRSNAKLLAVAVFINKHDKQPDFKVPLISGIKLEMPIIEA